MRNTCYVQSFNFFLGKVSEIQRSKVFPTCLPHHVTYDVMTIIKTFHMSSRTSGENFVSSGCGEKHESSVRTNKRTQMQYPLPSARVTREFREQHALYSLGKRTWEGYFKFLLCMSKHSLY